MPGSAVIQQLVGSGDRDDLLLCFAHNGYTTGAVEVADLSGVALFSYSVDRELTAVNETAAHLSTTGWVDTSGDKRIPEYDSLSGPVAGYASAVIARGFSMWERVAPAMEAKIARLQELKDFQPEHATPDERNEYLQLQLLRRQFLWLRQDFFDLVWSASKGGVEIAGSLKDQLLRFRKIESVLWKFADHLGESLDGETTTVFRTSANWYE